MDPHPDIPDAAAKGLVIGCRADRLRARHDDQRRASDAIDSNRSSQLTGDAGFQGHSDRPPLLLRREELNSSEQVGPGDAMGRAARDRNFVAASNRWSAAMPQPNDLSRSLGALDQNSTIIAVVEMSQSSWLVAGMEWFAERRSAAQAAQ